MSIVPPFRVNVSDPPITTVVSLIVPLSIFTVVILPKSLTVAPAKLTVPLTVNVFPEPTVISEVAMVAPSIVPPSRFIVVTVPKSATVAPENVTLPVVTNLVAEILAEIEFAVIALVEKLLFVSRSINLSAVLFSVEPFNVASASFVLVLQISKVFVNSTFASEIAILVIPFLG